MATVATLLLIIAAMTAAFPLIVRIGFRAPRIIEQGSPEQHGLVYREVSIPTENGKRLFAWFVPPPATGPAPAVAVLHGWGGCCRWRNSCIVPAMPYSCSPRATMAAAIATAFLPCRASPRI